MENLLRKVKLLGKAITIQSWMQFGLIKGQNCCLMRAESFSFLPLRKKLSRLHRALCRIELIRISLFSNARVVRISGRFLYFQALCNERHNRKEKGINKFCLISCRRKKFLHLHHLEGGQLASMICFRSLSFEIVENLKTLSWKFNFTFQFWKIWKFLEQTWKCEENKNFQNFLCPF